MEYLELAEFLNYGTNCFRTGGTRSGARTLRIWKISWEKSRKERSSSVFGAQRTLRGGAKAKRKKKQLHSRLLKLYYSKNSIWFNSQSGEKKNQREIQERAAKEKKAW